MLVRFAVYSVPLGFSIAKRPLESLSELSQNKSDTSFKGALQLSVTQK